MSVQGHDKAQCWPKCNIPRQQFTRIQESNHLSGSQNVIRNHPESLLSIKCSCPKMQLTWWPALPKRMTGTPVRSWLKTYSSYRPMQQPGRIALWVCAGTTWLPFEDCPTIDLPRFNVTIIVFWRHINSHETSFGVGPSSVWHCLRCCLINASCIPLPEIQYQ